MRHVQRTIPKFHPRLSPGFTASREKCWDTIFASDAAHISEWKRHFRQVVLERRKAFIALIAFVAGFNGFVAQKLRYRVSSFLECPRGWLATAESAFGWMDS
jgi:hypothetical protein